MPVTFDELIASKSPSSLGFSREGGRATLQVFVQAADFIPAISTFIGAVTRKGDGTLSRVVPRSHPQCPWMVCNRIANIQGYGSPTQTSASIPLEGAGLAAYAQYPVYLFTLEFVHEPFACLLDDAIAVRDVNYYADDGTLTATKIATEYTRFTSLDFKPQVEIVSATYGFLKFRTSDASVPNGNTFPGQPKVYVGKSVLTATWHFVPWSVIDDPRSKIVEMLGRVNQDQFLNYAAGSLLYTACGIRRYVAPVPEGIRIGNAVAFSHDYRCDVQFIFEFTDRVATLPPTPSNSSWIVNGHNAFPWFNTRKFYYVTAVDPTVEADTDDTKWVPSYLSFPFEWLWTDPIIL